MDSIQEFYLLLVALWPLGWWVIFFIVYREWNCHSGHQQVALTLLPHLATWVLAVALYHVLPRITPVWPLPCVADVFVGSLSGCFLALLLSKGQCRLWPLPINRPRRFLVQATIVLITSIAEEVIWRGFFFTSLVKVGWPIGWAVFVSSLWFGADHMHRGWRMLPVYVLIGGVLCGVFIVTGTLVAPASAHVAYNLAIVNYKLRADACTATSREEQIRS